MADRIKPHVVERVKLIRQWEKDMDLQEAKDIGFQRYHNYYAPPELIKNSKTVLSFGVGGDIKFEKLMLHENENLNIELFDPTPYTVENIRWIKFKSAMIQLNDDDRSHYLANKINFTPIAYGPTNEKQMFYYDPNREKDIEAPSALTQSFSLLKGEKHFKSVEVETKNIQTILQDLKWNSIDIVKADIEGLWEEFGNELLDNKIDFKYLATEFELNFDSDITTALDRATNVCNKFKDNNYVVIINRKREKLMLELLFIRKDIYAS